MLRSLIHQNKTRIAIHRVLSITMSQSSLKCIIIARYLVRSEVKKKYTRDTEPPPGRRPERYQPELAPHPGHSE